MDRSNIDKIAQSPEDRILLAKVWDKISIGMRKSIPSTTAFLTPREQQMAHYLLGESDEIYAFGGHSDAERKLLVYLPEYLDDSYLYGEDSPLVCIHATWHLSASPTHRDILGALLGAGISRESIGDICIDNSQCNFFICKEIASYILQNFSSAGRTSLQCTEIPLTEVHIPDPKTQQIRDTVASVRLDSIISSGFRISRSLAVQYISADKASIDGLPCAKPDKPISEGCKISVRGLGKIKLTKIAGQTKKGRISILIDRYI